MLVERFVNLFHDYIGFMWMELTCILSFTLGFVFLRVDVLSWFRSGQKREKLATQLRNTIRSEVAAGNMELAVAVWRATREKAPTPEDFRLFVEALVRAEPAALVGEVVDHMAKYPCDLCNSKTATLVLDVVARAGQIQIMEGVFRAMQNNFRIPATFAMYEALLGGHAAAGNESQVLDLCSKIRESCLKLTARGYSLIIKGFLKNGMLDAALGQIQFMQRQGYLVPAFAVMMLFRAACKVGRTSELFERVQSQIHLPSECVEFLLEHCLKSNDLSLARRVDQLAQQTKVPLRVCAYESLLKIYTGAGDLRALTLFQDMQESGIRISDGLCISLLARSAEARFLRFAEQVASFLRARGGMTIAGYSALMKVYAYSGMYEKACDLYDQILAEGLKPDASMYGCLMKFAVECGRTDLSRALFEKTPSLDIQKYMSLIRAAGRDRDVSKAFVVLQRIRSAGVAVDLAAYNCVLDVCVSAGDMVRALSLINEMKAIGQLDIITYNTLLKGYCTIGDAQAAQDLLAEMVAAGFKPNDISYNCLINAAASSGRFRQAWETIDVMEASGIPIDGYTVSIMLKTFRKVNDPNGIRRALALLDRKHIDVFSDEVLFNTVLEACTRCKEWQRLEQLLIAWERSGIRPSPHTYGTLIKSFGALKQVHRFQQLWHEIVELRAIEPTDVVLGCMLDALVSNDLTEEAFTLFNKWKGKVGPNMVLYSTVIKGFANSHQATRALEMWREMREGGLRLNTVVYNAIIDAHARAGAVDEFPNLVASMQLDGCVPDVITYSTLAKGYCVSGNLTQAFEVLRSIQKSNVAADAIVYNTVLDGCIKHNSLDLADQLLEDMERNRVTPSNFTLGIVVKMHGRRRQLDKAFEVVDLLPKRHGFTPDAQVMTSLMRACINNDAFDRALSVFKDLKALGKGATDAEAYKALISGALRHGQFQIAVDLVEEAYGLPDGRALPLSPQLETDIIGQLMRALAQHGEMERFGVPLLHRLHAARVHIGGQLLSRNTLRCSTAKGCKVATKY